MAGDLGKRVAVAAVGIPLGLLVIYQGGLTFGLLVAAIAAGATWELYRIAEKRGARPFTWAGVALSATFVLIAAVVPEPAVAAPRLWFALIAALLGLCAAAIWLRGVEGGPLIAVAVTISAALLTGGTLSYAVFLGALRDTSQWTSAALIGFPLLLTWTSDTCAYFGGRAWGTTKLIPSVSPGKTVAGAVSGAIGTTIVGALYAVFVFDAWLGIPIGVIAGAAGGALISVVAQVGDLSESLLKREAGVKDSGTLLPGHGGLFDRFDSLLFAFPVAYWYLSRVLGS